MFYRCKSCGGNVVYDPKRKKMVCSSCGNEETGELIPQEKQYICNNCGAQLEPTKIELSGKCPYCGTYLIFEDRLEGPNKPDYLLPFKISKMDAMEQLRDQFHGRLFLPSDFLSTSSLEHMEGIYVPYTLFDLKSHVNFQGQGETVNTWSDGEYEYTETKIFELIREFDVEYDKVPEDASKDMPDQMMDYMEPYQYQDLSDFQPNYFSGFLSNIHDEDRDALISRVKAKTDRFTDGYLADYNAGYASVQPRVNERDNQIQKEAYAFLPVYRYIYRYQGKNYDFFVNGQTGKIAGAAPISKAKLLGYTIGLFAGISFFLTMLFYLLEVL